MLAEWGGGGGSVERVPVVVRVGVFGRRSGGVDERVELLLEAFDALVGWLRSERLLGRKRARDVRTPRWRAACGCILRLASSTP